MALPEFSAARPSASCRMVAASVSSEFAFWASPSPTSDHASGEVVGHKPPIIAAENGRDGITEGTPTPTTAARLSRHIRRTERRGPPSCHSKRRCRRRSRDRVGCLLCTHICHRHMSVAIAAGNPIARKQSSVGPTLPENVSASPLCQSHTQVYLRHAQVFLCDQD